MNSLLFTLIKWPKIKETSLHKSEKANYMIILISLGTIPIGVDGFTQLLSPYESTNIVRLVTGMGAGFVLSWWSCAAISSKPNSFDTAELVKLPANAKLVFKD